MSIWILVSVAALTAVLTSYTMNFQGATLHWGKLLSPDNPYLPRGMQSAITPAAQTLRNISMFVLWITTAILGFTYSGWLAAVVAVVGGTLASGMIGVLLLPKVDSDYFRTRIRKSLESRLSKYRQSGDQIRSTAMSEVIEDWDELV